VTRYLTNRYRGVGDKTAEQLVEAFGAEHVFAALQAAPDRVVELLGSHRAGALLDAWRNDYARRSGEGGSRPPRGSDEELDADFDADQPPTSRAAARALEPESEPDVAPEPEPLAMAATPDAEAAPPMVGTEADASAPARGGVEREQPEPTTERETAGDASDREVLATDVEREGAPDLWTNARDSRVE
jgi:hypothetical protein